MKPKTYFFSLIALIILFISINSFGQKPDSIIKKKNGLKIFLGFKAGPFLSTYKSDSIKDHSTGLISGSFIEIQITKKFSLCSGFDYLLFKHHIEYSSNDTLNKEKYIESADFNLKSSIIQFTLTPKLSFGKKIKVYCLAGLYMNIPCYCYSAKGVIQSEKLNSGPVCITILKKDNEIKDYVNSNKFYHLKAGILIGTGVSIPCGKNKFNVEIATPARCSDFLSTVEIKHTSTALSFSYAIAL